MTADDLRHRCADKLLAKDAESWGYGTFEGDRDSALAIAGVVLAVQGEELETLRRANGIQQDQIRAYVSDHQEDTARWSRDLEKAEAALAEATAKLDRLTTRGQIAGEEIELANRRLRLIQREMNEQSERAEKAEAKLGALDALHPHTELNYWHPCKNHSITDEEPTLAACPNCLIEPVMGCPRCDDDCEIRAILHPDSPKDTTS